MHHDAGTISRMKPPNQVRKIGDRSSAQKAPRREENHVELTPISILLGCHAIFDGVDEFPGN